MPSPRARNQVSHEVRRIIERLDDCATPEVMKILRNGPWMKHDQIRFEYTAPYDTDPRRECYAMVDTFLQAAEERARSAAQGPALDSGLRPDRLDELVNEQHRFRDLQMSLYLGV